MLIILLAAGALYEFRKNRSFRQIIIYTALSAVAIGLKFLSNPETSIIKYIMNISGGI